MLLKDRYTIAATMDGDACPADDFIAEGEARYEASRMGLSDLLARVAREGLDGLSSKMTHEADKRLKIYEFIKGDLRLFYFKGRDNTIVICTAGVIKKGQKADQKAVEKAAKFREEYLRAHASGGIQWEEDGNEQAS